MSLKWTLFFLIGKRGLEAGGKACVAIAAIKDNVEYTDKNTGETVVKEKLKAVKFKIIPSENKVSITDFINESIPSDCLISCDASTTNKSLKLEGKLMDIQAFEKRKQASNQCRSHDIKS